MAQMTVTEADFLALLLAASSDEKMSERLAKLQKAMEEIQAANVDAARTRAEIEAMSQNLAGKRAELEKFERTLGEHNEALVNEKAAWEKIRQRVDAEQKSAAERLAKWELELTARTADLTSRVASAKDREIAANKRMAEAETKISALRAALDAVAPAPLDAKDAAS